MSFATLASAEKLARFGEEKAADFIARYYSDQTSYALKPVRMDGVYRSICDRALLLKLAEEQPGRDLAVLVLNHYPSALEENATKLAWASDLKRLGYRRVVFLRGSNKVKLVDGLPILESPKAAATMAGK